METRNPSITNNLFGGAYLDRRAEERTRPDWLVRALADPECGFIALQGSAALVRGGPPEFATANLVFLAAGHPLVATALAGNPGRFTLLGWFRDQRCVSIEVDAALDLALLPEGSRFEELRPLAVSFAPAEAGLFGYARALTIWRNTHRFCGKCAAPLVAARAGHSQVCSACGQQSFPRIDPAIIVLVSEGEGEAQRALLGRQAIWPTNRYSTIAGFAEPGESLEDAVRREVFEETSVIVERVDYHSSQPWPFPASMMVGFRATAAPGQLPTARDGELEDVRWFAREDLRSSRVLLPPAESISRQLINGWVAEGED